MSEYLTAGETADLLLQGNGYRRRVMSGPEMLTGPEMGKRVSEIDLCDTGVQLLSAWGKCGGVIELRDGDKRMYPEWQLFYRIWPHITSISTSLGIYGWALYNWMVTPHGGLDGKTPRQALEEGNSKRVLQVAEADGSA